VKLKARALFTFTPLLFLSASPVFADDRYWASSSSSAWGTDGNWSTDIAGTLVGTVPGSTDVAIFNANTVTGAKTIQLGDNRLINGMTFLSGSGPTTFLSGTGSFTNLAIGAGGITMEAGAGDVTFGNGSNVGGVPVRLTASQTWTNNSAGTLRILNSLASNDANPVTLTIAGSGNTTIINNVGTSGGTFSFIKEGSGTLSFSYSSNISLGGTVKLRGGTVAAGSAAVTTLSGGVILEADGTLAATTGGTLSVGVMSEIGGSFGFTKTGAGTVLLTAANTYTGKTIINEGLVNVRNATGLGAIGSVANGTEIGPNGTLAFSPTANTTFAETIALNGGTLGNLSAFTSTLSGPVTLGANSTLSSSGGSGSNLTISGLISESGGAFGFTKTGGNTVTLTNGNNTYTGSIKISEGTLAVTNITNGGALGRLADGADASSKIILDGGTLSYNSNDGIPFGFTLAAGKTSTIASTSQVLRFDGIATGSGNLIKTGDGTLVLNNSSNNYTGTTTINSGIVSVRREGSGSNSTLGTFTGASDGTIVNADGTLQIDPNGTGGSIANITVSEHITLNGGILRSQSLNNLVNGAVVLSANSTLNAVSGATLRVASVISGTGFGYTKTGEGTVVIQSTANTYTGKTEVSAGILSVTGNINSSTTLTVSGTGTFSAGASNIVNDSATVTLGGGILQMNGFSDSMGALVVTGAAELALGRGNSVLTFANSTSKPWADAALSITGWSGLVSGGGAERVLFDAAGLTTEQLSSISFLNPLGFDPGTYSAKFVNNELVPDLLIPEPSAMALVVLGAAVAGSRRRRAN
jgi:fibronectin-binding autotransporter adhesin